MNYIFILTILIIGLSGIVAQVLLLRELLVSFYGNELTIGVILANWVIAEALGVFIIGKIIDRIKNKINLFIFLEIIFSLILPVSIFLSRTFKGILGVPFTEAVGLYVIFGASLLIILPLSFCHGALFSAAAKLSSQFSKDPARSIGKVYSWETTGTIIGGIILTYLFIPYLNSFQIVFIISLSNLLILFFFLKYLPNKKINHIVLFLIILSILLFLIISPSNIHRFSINKQWKKLKVLDYRNSVYGSITVTKEKEQYTFFYNGSPIITTPYPDITFVEEFGHLPLLFHPGPKDALIISSGAGGLINEVLKHPVKKIDYAELDPLIIETLGDYPTGLTRHELADKRVNIINSDGRFFLKTTDAKYDIVLVGLSKPSDLSINRLFTQEFFSLVKKRLNPEGILALWLPGSLTYLSKELKDLNACILNGLKNTYDYVRIIPGDYNIFLASSNADIMDVSAGLISQRISEQNIKSNILVPAYIDYRLDKRWLDWFMRSFRDATEKINRDLAPFAVYKMLIFWNKQFSPGLAPLLASLDNLNLKAIYVLIFIMTALLFYIFRRRLSLARLNIAYSISTSGFFGMLTNLILIFSFQVFYGYLYHRIGILISIFMAGIALGSFLITRNLENIKKGVGLFIKLEIVIIIFSGSLALIITSLFGVLVNPSLIFISLFFIPGFLIGLEFPLASKIYLREERKVGEVSGLLYGADLLGGWLAGILGGIILLPVLGLFGTCMIIMMLKLSSLFLLIFIKRGEINGKRPLKNL